MRYPTAPTHCVGAPPPPVLRYGGGVERRGGAVEEVLTARLDARDPPPPQIPTLTRTGTPRGGARCVTHPQNIHRGRDVGGHNAGFDLARDWPDLHETVRAVRTCPRRPLRAHAVVPDPYLLPQDAGKVRTGCGIRGAYPRHCSALLPPASTPPFPASSPSFPRPLHGVRATKRMEVGPPCLPSLNPTIRA